MDPIPVKDPTDAEIIFSNTSFAGFWVRFYAMAIDSLILAPIYVFNIYNSLYFKSFTLMLVQTVLIGMYKPFFEWKNSATPGKKVMGLKVVNESMGNISGIQAIKRYFPWIISLMISLALNVAIFTTPEFKSIDQYKDLAQLMNASPLSSVTTISSLLFLILAVSLIVDPKKQGIHDKYAKTYCIKIGP